MMEPEELKTLPFYSSFPSERKVFSSKAALSVSRGGFVSFVNSAHLGALVETWRPLNALMIRVGKSPFVKAAREERAWLVCHVPE